MHFQREVFCHSFVVLYPIILICNTCSHFVSVIHAMNSMPLFNNGAQSEISFKWRAFRNAEAKRRLPINDLLFRIPFDRNESNGISITISLRFYHFLLLRMCFFSILFCAQWILLFSFLSITGRKISISIDEHFTVHTHTLIHNIVVDLYALSL